MKPNSAFLNTDQMSPVVHYRPGCPPALTDTEIEDEEGDELGKAIQQQHEEIIRTARPEFPRLDWRGEAITRRKLATPVNRNSWLIF